MLDLDSRAVETASGPEKRGRARLRHLSLSLFRVRPEGFSLIETMIALIILTVGLLATAQLIYPSFSSASLARPKGVAAIAAHSQLETLSQLYRQDQASPELSFGNHGPQEVQVRNPADGRALNRFNAVWTVSPVPDPRGRSLPARIVRVTLTPIQTGGAANSRASMNKVLSVTSILSPGGQ
jgi:prepilin-type N-terminal cleavage/methylation domain-containing protein